MPHVNITPALLRAPAAALVQTTRAILHQAVQQALPAVAQQTAPVVVAPALLAPLIEDALATHLRCALTFAVDPADEAEAATLLELADVYGPLLYSVTVASGCLRQVARLDNGTGLARLCGLWPRLRELTVSIQDMEVDDVVDLLLEMARARGAATLTTVTLEGGGLSAEEVAALAILVQASPHLESLDVHYLDAGNEPEAWAALCSALSAHGRVLQVELNMSTAVPVSAVRSLAAALPGMPALRLMLVAISEHPSVRSTNMMDFHATTRASAGGTGVAVTDLDPAQQYDTTATLIDLDLEVDHDNMAVVSTAPAPTSTVAPALAQDLRTQLEAFLQRPTTATRVPETGRGGHFDGLNLVASRQWLDEVAGARAAWDRLVYQCVTTMVPTPTSSFSVSVARPLALMSIVRALGTWSTLTAVGIAVPAATACHPAVWGALVVAALAHLRTRMPNLTTLAISGGCISVEAARDLVGLVLTTPSLVKLPTRIARADGAESVRDLLAVSLALPPARRALELQRMHAPASRATRASHRAEADSADPSDMDPFAWLPNELVQAILMRLSVPELLQCARVSRRWRAAVDTARARDRLFAYRCGYADFCSLPRPVAGGTSIGAWTGYVNFTPCTCGQLLPKPFGTCALAPNAPKVAYLRALDADPVRTSAPSSAPPSSAPSSSLAVAAYAVRHPLTVPPDRWELLRPDRDLALRLVRDVVAPLDLRLFFAETQVLPVLPTFVTLPTDVAMRVRTALDLRNLVERLLAASSYWRPFEYLSGGRAQGFHYRYSGPGADFDPARAATVAWQDAWHARQVTLFDVADHPQDDEFDDDYTSGPFNNRVMPRWLARAFPEYAAENLLVVADAAGWTQVQWRARQMAALWRGHGIRNDRHLFRQMFLRGSGSGGGGDGDGGSPSSATAANDDPLRALDDDALTAYLAQFVAQVDALEAKVDALFPRLSACTVLPLGDQDAGTIWVGGLTARGNLFGALIGCIEHIRW